MGRTIIVDPPPFPRRSRSRASRRPSGTRTPAVTWTCRCSFAPDVKLSPNPLDCYIFESRQEWANFTKRHTGADAAVYLQINRGGYTLNDWFVDCGEGMMDHVK